MQNLADYSGVFPVLDTEVFNLTELTNIKGQVDYPFYWSSTSNPVEAEGDDVDGGSVYAWVLAAGYNTDPDGNDLHGAGSVVFTPKSEENFTELDPEIHRYNYVRLVRGGDVTVTAAGDPSVIDDDRVVVFEAGEVEMPGGGGPDFAAVAAALGVTEDALRDAMGEPGEAQPNFAAIAETLGAAEVDLMNALGN